MGFKKVNQILKVNPDFFKQINTQVFSIEEWKDFNSKQTLGSKIEVVILEDNFDKYEKNTNQFEKITVKAPQKRENLAFKIGDRVQIYNASKSNFWGEQRDRLSVEAQMMDYNLYQQRVRERQAAKATGGN